MVSETIFDKINKQKRLFKISICKRIEFFVVFSIYSQFKFDILRSQNSVTRVCVFINSIVIIL